MSSEYVLGAKVESTDTFAQLFQTIDLQPVRLQIREDTCFKGGEWLDVGDIVLSPGDEEPGMDSRRMVRLAIEFGFFEWRCPAISDLQSAAHDLIGIAESKFDEQRKKVNRGLDGLVNVVCRLGLLHPIFDSRSVERMPFRRPTTVVTDTSAIIQGGLDFVVRFLYPMARVKVPAIAHMELLNASDSYMSLRRNPSKNAPGRTLLEHTISQGGQRALLRLELQAETEIERGRLGADPLRGIVQPESDSEDKSLKLSVVQRSFADRLIFETARQHSTQSNLDHPTLMMTSDQGLARMTLAEGMEPLFFEANKLERLSGRLLTGTTFSPFSGHLYSVSLTDLVWELAITFGAARLCHAKKDCAVEVCAIGEQFTWKPHHAKDDLLWVRSLGLAETDSSAFSVPKAEASAELDAAMRAVAQQGSKQIRTRAPRRSVYGGSYKFSLLRMLNLIAALASGTSLSNSDALAALGLKGSSQMDDYRNFLASGGFVRYDPDSLGKTDKLDRLWTALKLRDLRDIQSLLMEVPSFVKFIESIRSDPAPEGEAAAIASRSLSTYTVLAEISGTALPIPEEGLYKTPNNPRPDAFVGLALSEWERLSSGPEDWILTGDWLEALARVYGIHPLVARDRLEEARAAGLIERYAEGSTPDTRFSKHILHVLDLQDAKPTVQTVGLYEGTFLIPGRGSVMLRLKAGKEE